VLSRSKQLHDLPCGGLAACTDSGCASVSLRSARGLSSCGGSEPWMFDGSRIDRDRCGSRITAPDLGPTVATGFR